MDLEFNRWSRRNTIKARVDRGTCELCGRKADKLETHQVKKLKCLSATEDWERTMIRMRRKTLRTCEVNHTGGEPYTSRGVRAVRKRARAYLMKQKFCAMLLAVIMVALLCPSKGEAAPAATIQQGQVVSGGPDYIYVVDQDDNLIRLENGAPVKLLSDVVSVSNGYHDLAHSGTTAVVKKDGSLWTWEWKDEFMTDLSGEAATEPVKIMDDVISASAGGAMICGYETIYALKRDGSVWSDSQWSDPVKILDNAISVSAGPECAVAVKSDGSLWGWGNDTHQDNPPGSDFLLPEIFSYFNIGEYEDDNYTRKVAEPALLMDGVAFAKIGYDIASVNYKTLNVIKSDGSFWQWGVTTRTSEPQHLLDDVIYADSLSDVTVAITEDYTLWMSDANERTFTPVMKDVIFVTPQYSLYQSRTQVIAVKKDGTVWVWSGKNAGPGKSTYKNAEDATLIPGLLVKMPEADADQGYEYDTRDPGEDVKLPVELLDKITSPDDAAEAVRALTSGMTDEQKASPTGIDLATLYAERAAAKAATIDVPSGGSIFINAARLKEAQSNMDNAAAKVDGALASGGITTARTMAKTVIFSAGNAISIDVRVDQDVLTMDVDKVRVETDLFAITFDLKDLEADLNGILEFKAEAVGSARGAGLITPKAAGNKLAVKLTMPEGGTTNPITLSLHAGTGDTTYETLMLNGQASPSKYNPVTITIDGKTTSSGIYTTEENEVDFTDIGNKSQEMQDAIKNLAARGVLKGTSATTFNPDGTITRAEIATLLVKVLGLYDERSVPTYTDVTKADWFYVGAASSQKANLMSGFGDNQFHGKLVITKEQIAAASGNVLIRYMDYKVPANPDQYLKRYSDGVVSWGRDTIALVTRENIMLYRVDGKFMGTSDMSRGDAAIIINRLFSRIW